MKKLKVLLILLLLLSSISCTKRKNISFSIGYNNEWENIVTNGQSANLNGFFQDLFIKIARDSNHNISLINTNNNDLLNGLKNHKYGSVLSNMQMYNFNLAKFDFSKNILDIGYVLIVEKDSSYKTIDDLFQKHIGYISDDALYDVLQKYEVFAEKYANIPNGFKDLEDNQIDAFLLPIIIARKYIEDNYYNTLKILKSPVSDEAIRIITLKNQNLKILKIIDFYIEKYKKNGELKKLIDKWSLN
ncbi:MAG: ABC transporter arginine-binding protein 1 [Candidatus Anoxychlamydiales bacterium]|nr:ABC transporter arginine-binding protein 1 [Candidatus Anoxychlamydiales bacterium]